MILKNSYYYFKKALSDDFCDKVLEYGKEELKKNGHIGITAQDIKDGLDATKTDELKKGLKRKRINDKTREEVGNEKLNLRDSEICWLSSPWIFDKIIPIIQQANRDAGWNFQTDYVEPVQFTKYGLNQYYGWHFDGGSDIHHANGHTFTTTQGDNFKGLVRKLSVTINLVNGDEYEGGNLKFDYGPHSTNGRFKECTEIRERGSVVVFPSFIYHQVTPVTKGTRYSMVMWVNGKPFK